MNADRKGDKLVKRVLEAIRRSLRNQPGRKSDCSENEIENMMGKIKTIKNLCSKLQAYRKLCEKLEESLKMLDRDGNVIDSNRRQRICDEVWEVKAWYPRIRANFRVVMLYIGKMHGLKKLVLEDMEKELSEDNFFPPPNLGLLECLGDHECNKNTVNLSEGLCSRLKEVQYLTITRANMLQLSNGLGMLKNLKEVKFSSLNVIKGFKNIGKLSWITGLDLSYNQLNSSPTWINQLTQLTTLSLRCNRLSELPAWIGQLTQLTKLDLSFNQLTSLPVEIGQLAQLSELNLDGNKLASLPVEIGKLTQLTMLGFRMSQLSELPV